MNDNSRLFQIYTYGKKREGKLSLPLLTWRLHACSTNRDSSLLHAKMLALNPSFEKIQVEEISRCEKTGQKQAKTIKIITRKAALHKWAWLKSLLRLNANSAS